MQKILFILMAFCLFSGLGCGVCGRRLIFFVDVVDASGTPIEAATLTLNCIDADSGSRLTDTTMTNTSGEASAAVQAENRQCPENSQDNSSYFDSCTIAASASGFVTTTRTYAAANLDQLPVKNAGQAGWGVRATLVLFAQ